MSCVTGHGQNLGGGVEIANLNEIAAVPRGLSDEPAQPIARRISKHCIHLARTSNQTVGIFNDQPIQGYGPDPGRSRSVFVPDQQHWKLDGAESTT
jgi:hypothetical protein